MVSWYRGIVVSWYRGIVVSWYRGIVVLCYRDPCPFPVAVGPDGIRGEPRWLNRQK
jgi:hypothetical protein